MSSFNSDLEEPLVPLPDGVHLPSQTRILQLQLKHKIADQPSCSNKWTRFLFFAYHFLKLLGGIEIIVVNQQELPWAFTISIYSFLVLFYIITQYYVEKDARKYLRRNRIADNEIGSIKRLLWIQTALNILTVILAITCLGQYWWALVIIAINHAWGSSDGAFGLIFPNLVIESFFLLPLQLLLIVVTIQEIIIRIRRPRENRSIGPEPGQQAPRQAAAAGIAANQVQPSGANRYIRKVIKYSRDLHGDDACAICQVNYEEGDNLIQLPCNTKHYYHEACMQSWFQVRRICPLCRARVQNSFVE